MPLPRYTGTQVTAAGKIALPIEANLKGLELQAKKKDKEDKAKAAADKARTEGYDKFYDKLTDIGKQNRAAQDMKAVNATFDNVVQKAKKMQTRGEQLWQNPEIMNEFFNLENMLKNSQGRLAMIDDIKGTQEAKHVQGWKEDNIRRVMNADLNALDEIETTKQWEKFQENDYIREQLKDIKGDKISGDPRVLEGKYGQFIRKVSTGENITDEDVPMFVDYLMEGNDMFQTKMQAMGGVKLREEADSRGVSVEELKNTIDPATGDFMDQDYFARQHVAQTLIEPWREKTVDITLTKGERKPTGRGLGETGIGFAVEKDVTEKVKTRKKGQPVISDTHVWTAMSLDQNETARRGGILVKPDIVTNAETNEPLSTYLGRTQEAKDWIKQSRFIPTDIKEFTYDTDKNRIISGGKEDILKRYGRDVNTKKYVEGVMRLTVPKGKEDDLSSLAAKYNRAAEEQGLEPIDVAQLDRDGYYDLTVRIPYDKVSRTMSGTYGITPEDVNEKMGVINFGDEFGDILGQPEETETEIDF